MSQICEGRAPVEARGNAGSELFPDTDDRTLQRYLCEIFRLKKLPRTVDEWTPVFDRHIPVILKKALWPTTS
jgi:hypothetical protein